MAVWIDRGCSVFAGKSLSRAASTAMRSSSKNCGRFIGTGKPDLSGCGCESRTRLRFGFEGLGGELAIRLLEQDLDTAFGFLELLLAFAGERHAFFKELHGIIERQLRALQAADNFLEASEGFFEVRPFLNRRTHASFRRLREHSTAAARRETNPLSTSTFCSVLGLEDERVFDRRGFGLIGKWRKDRLAIVPIRKLVAVM